MTSPGPPADPLLPLPHTFRPRTSTGVVTGIAVLVVAVFVALAVSLPAEPSGVSGVLDRVGVAAGCLPLIVVLVLLGRPLVRAEPAGLVVRNLVRTRRLAWAQVVAVRFGVGDPWVQLDLSSGTALPVMAIQSADGARARRAARQLAALVEAHTRTERDT